MNVTAPSTGTKTIIPFEGQSILLADPAYVMPDEDMNKAGYTKFHTEHNGYGDGCWEVVNKDGSMLGVLWADSGEVGVFLYDEARERMDGHPLPAGTIILSGFTGTVSFSFKEKRFDWNNDLVSTCLVLHVEGRTEDGSEIDFTIDYSESEGQR